MADNTIINMDGQNAQQLTTFGVKGSTPATKIFAVNATGNLFVASTLNGQGPEASTEITAAAQKAFAQVSVFFAAMTKAITETENPKSTTTPKESYSIYDHEILQKVINKSGLFIQVGASEISFTSTSWGVEFSVELIQAVLGGFTGDLASVGKALFSIVTSAGKQGMLSINGESTSSSTRTGSIIFICEYLLGAVSITPMVVYLDLTKNESSVKAGPCFSTEKKTLKWLVNKDTYMFVPPAFMEQAGSMNEAMDNPDFLAMVKKLKDEITNKNSGNSGNLSGGGSKSGPTGGAGSGSKK